MHRVIRSKSPLLSAWLHSKLARHWQGSTVIAQQAELSTSAACAASSSASVGNAPRAAVLVIGDEILSGAIQDANTPWLASLLHHQGCDVKRFEYVPDDVHQIVDALQRMHSIVGNNGAVFTSGGIGPTHDDVTYEAVAQCFGAQCELHEPTLWRMHEHYLSRGQEVNDARKRMATLPKGSKATFTEGLNPPWVPLAEIHNTFILPGIPKLFKAMINGLMAEQKDRFTGPQHHHREVFSQMGEGDIADAVREAAAQFPKVHIGSYTNNARSHASDHRVKLVVQGRDVQAVTEAVEYLETHL